MSYLVITEVTKRYGEVLAVNSVSIDVREHEMISLLGPSGCGKTTLLRMIAGLAEPTSGSISLGGRLLYGDGVSIPAEKRNLGMVFQSYAIWPHMNVFDNVAYPVRVKRRTAALKQTVSDLLALVRLEGYASRMPHELSGGQQQRVALARALAVEPQVLLLDEPLSNLDAKLREEMRLEIKDLQRRLRMTIIYVTHDQAEAMSMSDRVAIMREGVFEQVGTPREVYSHPSNRFVAGFVGQVNFMPGTVVSRRDDTVTAMTTFGCTVECTTAALPGGPIDRSAGGPAGGPIRGPLGGAISGPVTLAVRPEEIELSADPDGIAIVENVTFLGSRTELQVGLVDLTIRVEQSGFVDLSKGDRVSVRILRGTILA